MVNFSCETKELKRILSAASKIAVLKASLPILSNVFLNAYENKLELWATDLEIGIKLYISANVEKNFQTTVSAKLLYDIVNNLDEKILNFVQKESNILEINGENFKYQLNTLPVEDYPTLPTDIEEKPIVLNQKIFKDSLQETLFAAAGANEDNVVLSGVLFKIENNKLNMVALDGYRLAKKSFEIESGNLSNEIIIPAKALSEVSKLLNNTDDKVEIFYDKFKAVIKANNFVLFSRLLEHQFPQYERVFPKEINIRLIVNKEKLSKALKRICLISIAKESPNLIKLNLKNEKFYISANTQDVGNGYEEVEFEDLDSKTNEDFFISFNAKYLLDVLTILECKDVRLEFSNYSSPGIITKSLSDDFVSVIMPVRTLGTLP